MPKVHLARGEHRDGVFKTVVTQCGVWRGHSEKVATFDTTLVTCKFCAGTHQPMGRKHRPFVTKADLQDVLQQIMQVLGPEAVCACAGCAWETNEAIRLMREVGVEYQPRKAPKPGPPHDVEKERLGNGEEPL